MHLKYQFRFMLEAAPMWLSQQNENRVYCMCLHSQQYYSLCIYIAMLDWMHYNQSIVMCQWDSWSELISLCTCVWGENETACVHAIRPDNNINLPVFWVGLNACISECAYVCVIVWDREWESVFMACVCVPLLDRCVSQPQVGGRGINSCPSPCR